MSSQTMGIDYFGVATDIKDDDKVFALRYRYATKGGGYDAGAAYAAFGRLIDLLADIYREGFAAEMTPPRRFRLSQQMGLTPDELDEFLEACVDADLFDRDFWENDQVLTSRGIQRRYYIVASRRRGTIPESQRKYLLIDDAPGSTDDQGDDNPQQDGASEGQGDATEPQHETTLQQVDATLQQVTESCPTREEKRREGKRSKGKEREEEEKGAAAKPRARSSSSSSNSKSPKKPRKTKRHEWDYPLACFSRSGGDRLYDDGSGGVHESAWDALVTRLGNIAPDCDMGSFAAAVGETCPAGCDESAECVSRCNGLICGALDRFDKTRHPSPIPLVVKVLEEDRGEE